jgi:acetylornithine deacetylase
VAAIDPDALIRDASRLVQVPSVTGDELAALERAAELAEALGLEPRLVRHDLDALRADPGHPGEEAPREELWGVVAGDGPLAFCNHIDVVAEGAAPWRHGTAWSGAVEGGFLWGRGSVDMKGGVAAALHALAAAGSERATLYVVAGEEDGGLGAFAALRAGADGAQACVIPEPTGFDVVCAQAGALTFTGTVPGVAAHAAERLHGISAIDRYIPVHQRLAEHETAVNADVEHPLMAQLELPYPLLVGRVEAGEWSSSVPDRLVFEGRAPVRVGEDPAAARAAIEEVVSAACPEATLEWSGGQFASSEADPSGPLATAALAAVSAELDRPARPAGVPWGADMRLWTAAGVPTVMVGPRGIEHAHAVDERVATEDLVRTARVLARIATDFSPR